MTTHTFHPDQYARDGLAAGCAPDQMENLIRAGLILQPRQLAASAAARLCDQTDGPTAIGYGGARGGGKSHWLLAQLGADDCQRVPGLKCLLLRKVGRSNLENFEDLRQRVLAGLEHSYNASRGILTFENGSRIVARHYQHEKEIDALLGLEYDVIAIEEATTLTQRKYQDIRSCLRTSKPGWRPRLYSTTNPGGVGHDWYYRTFIQPHERGTEADTRFIPARVQDNKFLNVEYRHILGEYTGWQREAWLHGNWAIASGQFFNTFRPAVHIVQHVNLDAIVEWFAGMDYGYTHYTVFLLAGRDADGTIFVVDEHAERNWIPQRHVQAIREMCQRNKLFVGNPERDPMGEGMKVRRRHDPPYSWRIRQISAGGDLFSKQYDGNTLAGQFASLGVTIRPANTNRVQGWADVQQRLGDPEAGIKPTLFIHERCQRLLNTLPYLQHDPDQPADILKTNVNEAGLGGDDAADALRYLVATRIPWCGVVRLRGL
jgi:phage terminase large subunit